MATTTSSRKKNTVPQASNDIFIKGARMHNLRNVDVTIPRNKLVVVTGVSGSGKSSLTIDTLFAEGQRRYAESLSAYARQFMQRMDKPDVDYIHGLCPAIAIEQKVITRTPRSTVGSMTEIYDYLRLLFARAGDTISPVSGRAVKKDDVQDVIQAIQQRQEGDKVLMLVPFRVGKNRKAEEELSILLQKGFARLYLHKEVVRMETLLEDQQALSQTDLTQAYLLVDRIVVRSFDEDDLHRMADSIGTAFYEGDGEMLLEVNGELLLPFNNRFELDGIKFEEPVPNLFSFNNPYGACPTCEGFSQVLGIDEDLVIPNKLLSVYEGAVAPWKGEKLGWWRDQFIRGAKHIDFPIHKPIADLTAAQMKQLWHGHAHAQGIKDFFADVETQLYKVQFRVLLSRYRGRTTCPDCRGYRLRPEALYVQIGGKHIGELCEMPVGDLKQWFNQLTLRPYQQEVAKRILLELHTRMQTLLDVGLGYLTLNRLANSLSGGESQRIQLTRSLGSNLTNSLYILDEPSIGLHSRDTERLIGVLKKLRDLGNTVVVVEHDEMMMREADHVIDMGPLASHLGGEVVATGHHTELMKNERSLTGRYLSGEWQVVPESQPRTWKQSITVNGARQHNLKNIDVEFPLGVFTVVSGVSGSGKTTLIKQILYPALMQLLGEGTVKPGLHKGISGDVKAITQVELVDQNPIGKSSRSNPVTYVKAYDEIRDLFAEQPLSKMRGFQPRHFSFNVDGGRCDACKGEGEQLIEMQFLADVHLPCDVCKGRKFKDEVLEVHYREKSVHDVLEMSVDQAIAFFQAVPEVAKKLKPLAEVGLGYIKLGQSSSTLSGGEAQRVKLASFLGRGGSAGQILFIFDEPTTGLHFHDIQKLLGAFHALIRQGHSVLVIEHNTDVIRSADWVIDLGPEAGAGGGELVFAGLPKQLKKCRSSATAKFL